MEHTSTSKHDNSYHNILASVSTLNSLAKGDVKVSINIYLLKAAAVVLSEST